MVGRSRKIKAVLTMIIITAVFVFRLGKVQAAQEQFLLSLDSTQLQVGVGANLVVSLVNAQNADVKEITGLDNFDVISTNQSQTTQIVNNTTSYEKDITYVIMPKTAGNFTLKATVDYNGQTYETNELQLTVSETQDVTDAVNGEASDIFLKTILSDKEIYFGQKVALSYEMYTRYNLENYGFLDSVNIDGFVANQVSDDKLASNYVTIGSNKYARYELKKMYLSPIKTGTYTIPAFNFQANASTGGFFGTVQPYYLKTDSEDITVKPLPQEGQPTDFSGIVGKLNIDASYDKQSIDYNDSLTLNVTASGNCNLDSLDKLIKNGIPGFSVYETEKNSEEGIQEDKYYAKKEFNVILVPENTGDIKIDPIKISYFDPETGKYENAEIPGATITVTGNAPQENSGQNNTQQGDVSQGQSGSYHTVEISQVSYGEPQKDGVVTLMISKTAIYTGVSVMAILIILAAAIFIILKNRKQQDKTLTEIYNQLKKADNQNEIYNFFNQMMKYRFNINLKASPREDIINSLNTKGELEPELTGPLLEIMDQMERMSSGTGTENLKNKMKVIYKKLNKLKSKE